MALQLNVMWQNPGGDGEDRAGAGTGGSGCEWEQNGHDGGCRGGDVACISHRLCSSFLWLRFGGVSFMTGCEAGLIANYVGPAAFAISPAQCTMMFTSCQL